MTFESSRLVGAELYTSVHTCQLYAHLLCGRPSPPPALLRRSIDVVTLPTPRHLAHLLSIFRQRCSASWFNQDDGFLSSPAAEQLQYSQNQDIICDGPVRALRLLAAAAAAARSTVAC